jgi:hypothetical protein
MTTVFLMNGGTLDAVGILPLWLDPDDPRPAKEQFGANYGHGGGWQPFEGFRLLKGGHIKYPGDPAHKPLAMMKLRDEVILIYPHAWVLILQKDGSFEICRMD